MNLLLELLNMTAQSFELLVAWLVAALVPDIPHPILVLEGEQGTGKSTAEWLIASVVDPSRVRTWTPPQTPEDLIVASASAWIIPIDNISFIRAWFSDALCRLVTGVGWVARQRYTDREVNAIEMQRVIILDGIDVGTERGDLVERTLPVGLERIPAHRRRRDDEIAGLFREHHPAILYDLLDVTSQVLERLPYIHLTEMPRMADFARISAAVDEVRDTHALATYLAQETELAATVVESDAVASAIRDWVVHGAPAHTLTAGALLEELLDPGGVPWPHTPRGMAGALKRVAPSMERIGITVSFHNSRGTGGARLLTITDNNRPTNEPIDEENETE